MINSAALIYIANKPREQKKMQKNVGEKMLTRMRKTTTTTSTTKYTKTHETETFCG